ncbi:MAG: polyphenol oxidase family protein [Phycisphaera sp.]|nr:polyphenol oxidase family protein [Phycisphaera sp.]
MNPLREDRASDRLVVLRSNRLEAAGFQHAFSTAIGPDREIFDLAAPGSSPMGTDPATNEAFLRRFAREFGGNRPITTVTQVHSAGVAVAPAAPGTEADAIIVEDSGPIAAVRTADCVPILIGCPRTGLAAAVHAGWRGLVADVPGATINALRDRGAETDDLIAAIGPAIGIDAFEVGDDVVAALDAAGLATCLRRGPGRSHADLFEATVSRLRSAGLKQDRIDGHPLCTASDERFFSHRGASGRTGRHLAGIVGIGGFDESNRSVH